MGGSMVTFQDAQIKLRGSTCKERELEHRGIL